MAALLVPLALVPPGALAQATHGGTPGGYLAAPSLPPTLPGGLPLPSLPQLTQQDMLQRILDGGATRPPAQPPPSPPPLAVPAYAPGPEEPLSPPRPSSPPATPAAPAASPIGYDNLRGGVPQGQSFGILPEDYLLGRDDEVVLAFRGRVRQTLTLRIGRDGTLLVPELRPFPPPAAPCGSCAASWRHGRSATSAARRSSSRSASSGRSASSSAGRWRGPACRR
ncbi:hypothetical protein ACFQU2_26705 [Siccirubricoccus deserti]